MKLAHLLRSGAITAAVLAGSVPAFADMQVKDGNGTLQSVCTKTYGSTVHAYCHTIVDVTGVAFGTLANPFHTGLTFGGVDLTLGQKLKAGSLPVALPLDPDILNAAATITAADAASTTATGQNSVSVVSGTPTTGSVYSYAVNGQSEADFTVTNTFTGTLVFEGSANGGLTWTPRSAHVMGTKYRTSTITAPGIFHINAAGLTNIRVRATALASGTPSVQLNTTSGTGSIYVMNPIELTDNTTGLSASIKAGGSAALSDPALAVQDPSVVAAINSTAVASGQAGAAPPANANIGYVQLVPGPQAQPVAAAETGTAVAAGGITPVTGFTNSLVCKAAAGNFYSAYGQNPNSAPFYLVALNQTTPPAANAAITAANVLDIRTVPANGDGGVSYGAGPAKRFGTGISLIATTSLTTFTAPTTAPFLSSSCL